MTSPSSDELGNEPGDLTLSVRTPARVGLLGNPSDGFGGRVIATTIDDFAATVTATPSDQWQLVDGARRAVEADSVVALGDQLGALGEGAELLAAAVVRLAAHLGPGRLPPRRLAFTTDIPRQCGLSGSSAVIISTLRALAPQLSNADCARLALEAETEVLHWTAGPQDRVVQAMGGPVDMDFARGWKPSDWHRLDPATLPPLVVAWYPTVGETSDVVHRDVRGRFDAGDERVVSVMRSFAGLAATGRLALDKGTARREWPDLLDRAWNLRGELWALSPSDEALVDAARSHGIGASLAGSGGAIVGVPRDPGSISEFATEARALGAATIEPTCGEVIGA